MSRSSNLTRDRIHHWDSKILKVKRRQVGCTKTSGRFRLIKVQWRLKSMGVWIALSRKTTKTSCMKLIIQLNVKTILKSPHLSSNRRPRKLRYRHPSFIKNRRLGLNHKKGNRKWPKRLSKPSKTSLRNFYRPTLGTSSRSTSEESALTWPDYLCLKTGRVEHKGFLLRPNRMNSFKEHILTNHTDRTDRSHDQSQAPIDTNHPKERPASQDMEKVMLIWKKLITLVNSWWSRFSRINNKRE
jgi:hypothetical protein